MENFSVGIAKSNPQGKTSCSEYDSIVVGNWKIQCDISCSINPRKMSRENVVWHSPPSS